MASMGTSYKELKTQVSSELVGLPSTRNQHGGFVIVGESDFTTLPQGACVCIQSVSFSKLQAGDYILISGEGKVAARRFVKLSTANGVTRLVVTDGANRHESLPFPRLLGLITGVKLDGRPFNPNPQGFLQRAAFKLRHTFATTA